MFFLSFVNLSMKTESRMFYFTSTNPQSARINHISPNVPFSSQSRCTAWYRICLFGIKVSWRHCTYCSFANVHNGWLYMGWLTDFLIRIIEMHRIIFQLYVVRQTQNFGLDRPADGLGSSFVISCRTSLQGNVNLLMCQLCKHKSNHPLSSLEKQQILKPNRHKRLLLLVRLITRHSQRSSENLNGPIWTESSSNRHWGLETS
jgi:hypothetical protein